MGAFPEDYEIKGSRLMSVWIAEGFVKSDGDKRLEEEARNYLKALVERNLLLVKRKKYNGKLVSYSIHDLLRDLCLRKATEEMFLNLKDSMHRVSVYSSSEIEHVVDVMGIEYKVFPKEILQLFNLCYLTVSCTSGLPIGISRLWNLQTLILRWRTNETNFPKLQKLHVIRCNVLEEISCADVLLHHLQYAAKHLVIVMWLSLLTEDERGKKAPVVTDVFRNEADLVYEAEDIIESRMVHQMLSNPESKSLTFSTPYLQQVTQELYSAVVNMAEKTMRSKSDLVGVDADLLELKDRLTNMERKVKIIPLIGMGGIGKSTLAQNLYNNATVSHFDYRGWDAISQSLHHVRLLNKFVSRDLLCRIMFGEEDCPGELQEVATRIGSDCSGFPLAIHLIGGLFSKVERSRDVSEHISMDVKASIVESNEHFSNILSLSYNHLSIYLKQYRSLEDDAEDYLKALVERNLLLVRRKKHNGKPMSYSIHDLLRDLCIRKSNEVKFLNLKDSMCRISVQSSDGIEDVHASPQLMLLTTIVTAEGYKIRFAHKRLQSIYNVWMTPSLIRNGFFEIIPNVIKLGIFYIDTPDTEVDLSHLHKLENLRRDSELDEDETERGKAMLAEKWGRVDSPEEARDVEIELCE
ncbi:hypothetical protein SASPL_114917 [Salvia splendens]|uniref:Disease resistance protein RPM1 n=1 Tax=Salvia splendens TaxID=180675 RepID=A0A8X9A2I5_SALSN|nr:hypothetical protein SASPL_114917 [Salvia splendens]